MTSSVNNIVDPTVSERTNTQFPLQTGHSQANQKDEYSTYTTYLLKDGKIVTQSEGMILYKVSEIMKRCLPSDKDAYVPVYNGHFLSLKEWTNTKSLIFRGSKEISYITSKEGLIILKEIDGEKESNYLMESNLTSKKDNEGQQYFYNVTPLND